MRTTSFFSGVVASFGTLGLAAGAAVAQVSLPVIGRPVAGGIGFQTAGTELARDLHGLDHFLLVIIGAITVFVTLLLAWVLVRYNQRVNKTPATFTHNSPLEVAWTIVPIVILVFIGAFSLPVLFKQQEIPAADINIKVTGSQWFWSYEYPDDGVSFDSFLIGEGKVMNASVEAELVAAGYSKEDFLLATDTALVLP
ncbi:MAG: cytochrome c oxidase subunit II transmembrane domain-containing protein, partial [Paracoccaceae bacterium]|nr:cytochrome c oxidase subunit II transmembrane domain-containing protein [Paracoccaceae bacterium]